MLWPASSCVPTSTTLGQVPKLPLWVLPALQNLLTAADEAELDAVGALAEDLIAEENRRRDMRHGGCRCGREEEE